MSWLVIGISGVTCGGKTTLSKSLFSYLSDSINEHCLSDHVQIGTVKIVNQDDYFYPDDYTGHEWLVCGTTPHVNYDVLGALNMKKMCSDLYKELGKHFVFYTKEKPVKIVNIMIIDGFLIFNHGVINRLCQLKFHIHLPYEKCYERRIKRTYEPPDCSGYFEVCVWPYYEENFAEIKNKQDVMLLNGEISKEKIFQHVFDCIKNAI